MKENSVRYENACSKIVFALRYQRVDVLGDTRANAKIIAAYEIGIMLAGGECTLCTRHSRVQQLGSTHLSGPTMFAHGQQILYKPYDVN